VPVNVAEGGEPSYQQFLDLDQTIASSVPDENPSVGETTLSIPPRTGRSPECLFAIEGGRSYLALGICQTRDVRLYGRLVSGDRLLLQFAKLRVSLGQASEGLRQRQPS
jgi:hypothetical protein